MASRASASPPRNANCCDIPLSAAGEAETEIPKTLLELEGNEWFNFNPDVPEHGYGVKLPDPGVPFTWSGDRFSRDEDGNYRFVWSDDSQMEPFFHDQEFCFVGFQHAGDRNAGP